MRLGSEGFAAVHCTTERHGVGELEIASVGDTAGDARDHDGKGGQLAPQEERRRFSIDARRRGNDHFLDEGACEARREGLDGQILGADTLEGRQELAEDEVASAMNTRSLDCEEILDLRHDAEDGVVSPRICADVALRAHVELREVSAKLAGTNALRELEKLAAELRCDLRIEREMEQIPIGRALANARQARKELDDTT